MDTLLSVGRILEISESTANNSDLFESRKKEIAKLPAHRKALAATLLQFTNKYPALGRQALDKIASSQGYSFLGSGVDYSAYLRKEDERVVKVHRASAGQENHTLSSLQETVSSQHALLSHYLGETVIDSAVYVDEHILGGGYMAVQIEQPFIDTTSGSPFTTHSPDVEIPIVEHLVRSNPGADIALFEFCEGSKQAHMNEGLVPDTNGANNVIVLGSGDVALIDTVPVGQNHPAVQDLISQQIASLENALREVA